MHFISHALKSTPSPDAAIFEYIIFVGALEAAGMVGGLSALPEKLFDFQVRLAAVCPETALMYAVLENAFLCFHQQFEIQGRRSQQGARPSGVFLAMILTGFFPSSLYVMCSGLILSTYERSSSTGPNPA